MTVPLTEVQKGHEFPPVSFNVTPEWVGEYVAAVQDGSVQALEPGVVPPMAAAALCVRALLEQSVLPPGAVHASQEFSFERALRVGDALTAAARIVSRGERAGWVLLGVALEATSGGETVLSGRALLTFPVDPEAPAT